MDTSTHEKLSPAQRLAFEHLSRSFVGPLNGPNEIIERPDRTYLAGILFPRLSESALLNQSEDRSPEIEDIESEDLQLGAITLAESWRPSSAAISFMTKSNEVFIDYSAGHYDLIRDEKAEDSTSLNFIRTPLKGLCALTKQTPSQEVVSGSIKLEIGSTWRDFKDGQLVTVHIRIKTRIEEDSLENRIPHMLYQTRLNLTLPDGEIFEEYRRETRVRPDPEADVLDFRYRHKKTFAAGHGMSADWEIGEDAKCYRIALVPLPAFVVPNMVPRTLTAGSPGSSALSLNVLSSIEDETDAVIDALDEFVKTFLEHIDHEDETIALLDDQRYGDIAMGLSSRARDSARRMKEGVALLHDPSHSDLRRSFALAMSAMRLQMQQSSLRRGGDGSSEPTWRPFQLGFILQALSSTVDSQHEDREVVDLIWFPTGGGKTEAYLALAAIEIFRRHIVEGVKGGGTAVITRYTLRLLTTQQFERSAALICAMELLRQTDSRAQHLGPFSIGLWVGGDVTPNTKKEATDAVNRIRTARVPSESNRFQVQVCPWCGVDLLPHRHSHNDSDYGFSMHGSRLVVSCSSQSCDFNTRLPLLLVDQDIYENPPTFLLSTVDKFALLQFKTEAKSLLGLGSGSFTRQPSLIIQDELHLLSGPLGTTVAVFDHVLQVLLEEDGVRPKMVASTATIRSSDEQVRRLYGREVSLYPPSGLTDDSSFFSQPDPSGSGRLYLGILPSHLALDTATVSAMVPLLELPMLELLDSGALDDYWTMVAYYNNLKDLGRGRALLLDSVNSRLSARANQLDMETRTTHSENVVELTSRRASDELSKSLQQLEIAAPSSEAVDAVISSNMLSVGIDVPRLALMLMMGQPLTTSEYIQATSRVGRGSVRGIVVTFFRHARARDRSHYEMFRNYHEKLYFGVEPTSVTPWSLSSRRRSLPGAIVALLRTTIPELGGNSDAINFDRNDRRQNDEVQYRIDRLLQKIQMSESREAAATKSQINQILGEWDFRASEARKNEATLNYTKGRWDEKENEISQYLLKQFGQEGQGWIYGTSMRSIDPSVAVEIREPSPRRRS